MSDTPAGPSPADEPGLPGFAAPADTGRAPGYRVLARKYRPRSFDDLIGQDAMVRTIANAFATNRIPQAWMLTGVRGVGKTTTARILARGLNFIRADGTGSPTIDLSEPGVHCEAIIEGRHIDVQEIDAASNNGVDNVRQINDAMRYAPVSARYKVYIIDEVHMLSPGAFNAFLKTLEEPPPHAKFVFATTEIRKVPVTILSRCQRFDLRRVETATLLAHLEKICTAESVTAEPDALAAIARAGEGSVRDALSLLDQAIAHGAGNVTAENVRAMLGLADRAQVIDLFEATMRGDLAEAFASLRRQYDAGADPAVMIADLAAFTHLVTRIRIAPGAADDPALTQEERTRGRDFASRLPIRALAQAWQMLLKALPEVQGSNNALAAAEMALVRIAYASDLPSPEDTLRKVRAEGEASAQGSTPSGPAPGDGARAMGAGSLARTALATVPDTRPRAERMQPAPQQAPQQAPGLRIARFEDLVALAAEQREIALKAALEQDVRLVRFEDGVLEFSLAPGGAHSLPAEIGRRLQEWTGRRWMVALSTAEGAPTIRERTRAAEEAKRDDAREHPLVQAVLRRFPKAEIVRVEHRGEPAPPPDTGEPVNDANPGDAEHTDFFYDGDPFDPNDSPDDR